MIGGFGVGLGWSRVSDALSDSLSATRTHTDTH